MSVVFALSMVAQPRSAAAAGTDAGATKDAGSTGALDASASSKGASTEAGASTNAPDDGGVTGPSSVVGDATASSVPTFRKAAPPLPRPTPQQIAAYEAMEKEAKVYEDGAREYKQTLTDIITLHYEAKKRQILSGLEREITAESAELEKARDKAIERLRYFVDKYGKDPLKDPVATPDAMYRLAALYEEKARNGPPDQDLAVNSWMNDAIALYKRVIREFPKYRELAGVYYFLGHALKDQARKPEAMQVWRALVCTNHYGYPNAKDQPGSTTDTVAAMPQDNTPEYWQKWRDKYTTRDNVAHAPKNEKDMKYVEVYPADCAGLAQPSVKAGDEPRYVAEVWLNIGNWEFDNDDRGGGVSADFPYAAYDFNRAASAYQNSMRVAGKRSIVYGVSLYKYAWTLFKQERYEAATKAFVSLLLYTDELEKMGTQVADFRSEAYTYIAGSLAQTEFTGPGPDDPYAQSVDIFTSDPKNAEKKLLVAFDRVKDPNLIPQDRPWTIEIYKALALEYRAIPQYASALLVYNEIQKRWPMDPSAPDTQNAIAETYDLFARSQMTDSPERKLYETEALKARTKLSDYVGDKPWVDANKDNPKALQRAEQLVRQGLKDAANQHTFNAKEAYEAAKRTTVRAVFEDRMAFARDEYKLAALGWSGYISQDQNAPDNYESRFFLAYCMKQLVRIQVDLNALDPKKYPEPNGKDIEDARKAAVDVRDSDEDDTYLDDAATYVVDLSDVGRDLAFQRFDATKGAQGIENRTDKDPEMQGPEGQQKVVEKVIPAEIQASMQARDEYIMRVPPDKNGDRTLQFLMYSAEQYYLYGHFKEARERFEPIYRENCGKNIHGYRAWARLLAMSNFENDADRSRQLAEAAKAKSCAVNDDQRDAEQKAVTPTLMRASFQKARVKFAEAQQAEKDKKPSAEVQALYLDAARMFEEALKAPKAAESDEAPEAAINGGIAYLKSGKTTKALEMYRLFIDKYGNEDILKKLEKDKADNQKKGKSAAAGKEDPYDQRVKYLLQAQEDMSATYYSFFDYRRAAEGYSKIATSPRFPNDRRQNAAKIAMYIYANMGDRQNMNTQYGILIDPKFNLPAEKRADADYTKAEFEYKQWDPNGQDTGANATARRQAYTALSDFHQKNANNGAAARYALQAAYKLYKMLRSVGDGAYHEWATKTIAAYQFFEGHPYNYEVTDSEGKKTTKQITATDYNDYPSDCAFMFVDEKIKREFDWDPSKPNRYPGNIKEVPAQYEKDFEKVEGPLTDPKNPNSARDTKKGYVAELQAIRDRYKNLQWAPAILARQGSLYDTLYTALNQTPLRLPPDIERLIAKMEANNQFPEADAFRDQARDLWNNFKLNKLEIASGFAVKRYAAAAVMARAINVKDPTVQRAIDRLAKFTVYLGEPKMKTFVELTDDPSDTNTPPRKLVYTDRMFLQWRSGRLDHTPTSGTGQPLPINP